MRKCKYCLGKGKVEYSLEDLESCARMGGTTNYDPGKKTCPKCNGKGKIK